MEVRSVPGRILTLNGPAKSARPIRPANVLKLGAGCKILSIFCLKIQVFIVAGIRLDVDTVLTEVESLDVRIVAITSALRWLMESMYEGYFKVLQHGVLLLIIRHVRAQIKQGRKQD